MHRLAVCFRLCTDADLLVEAGGLVDNALVLLALLLCAENRSGQGVLLGAGAAPLAVHERRVDAAFLLVQAQLSCKDVHPPREAARLRTGGLLQQRQVARLLGQCRCQRGNSGFQRRALLVQGGLLGLQGGQLRR